MTDFAYARLSELDRSFLLYEGPNSPMHVGAVQILEAAPLRGPNGAIAFERVLEYVESRLHRIPRYRQHVVAAPLDGHPIWVDDPRFNLRYHVRHSRLPRPGDERVLKRTCARILEQRLDLRKPLWELWLVEGLDGDRVALVNKIHHCMVDGVSGADLMSVLMTAEATSEIEPAPLWLPRRGPTAAEYAASETAARLLAPLDALRAVGRLVTDEDHARAALVERLEAAGRVLASGVSAVPATPLNQPIGPHRRFDWLAMRFEDIQFVRRRLGGTANDVVLAVVAGAVRRFFKHVRLTDPDGIEFRVMAPVSMREARERGALGNRVAAWFLPLPIGERDPLVRYARVLETTAGLKRRHEALGAETLTQVVGWLGSAPIALGARLLERSQPPFHMVVTNVPGPRVALHLLGARMLEAYPLVPLLGQLSLGIALFSYDGVLSWGFAADWELVPDLHEFVRAAQRAFDQLLARAREAPDPPAAAIESTARTPRARRARKATRSHARSG
jgi:diacylglycerol O-acyltransferase